MTSCSPLVADEEDASIGTEEVLTHLPEPGRHRDRRRRRRPSRPDRDLVAAHKGFVWADVIAHRSSPPTAPAPTSASTPIRNHHSRPAPSWTGLDRAGSPDLAARPGHPVLGVGSVHAGVIRRRTRDLVLPRPSAVVTVERRTVPGEDTTLFEAELRAILDPITAAQPGLGCTLAMGLERRPLDGDPTRGITPTLRTAVADVTGRPARHRGEAFWTDAALLAEAGIPAVLFGVDGAGAHASTEWVDLGSLHDTARAMERAITAWTGRASTE